MSRAIEVRTDYTSGELRRLAAARNVRPYIIHVYPRDMGNGITIMMREIDAPIRVFGKHWGGLRTAYNL